MARTVYVPEAGGALDFPDGTSDQQIVDFVRAKYAPKPAPAPPEAGIGALESGFYGALGRAEAAGGKAAQGLGIDWLASDLFERSRASTAYAEKYKPDVASVTDIQGVGDAAKFAGSTIAQSAPETAVGLAGAYAGAATGAAIGSVVPGPGTAVGGVVGGIVGGAIASLPFFIGGNIQAQAREQGIPLEETSGYAASVGAAAQAPLDAAFDTLIARKFPGSGAALDVVKKGFLKEVASTAGKAAVTEALTEPAQQAIEIAQSNPNKLLEFSPDVQNELLNAAAAGALAGGVIGGAAEPVARVAQGYARGKQREIDNQLAADVTAAAQGGEQMKRFVEINSGVEKLAAQTSIGQLKLGKVQIDPTPENGLKAPITRFQILDNKNQSIAEFSDPVHATDAVNTYSKLSGKKINLVSIDKGKASQIPTVTPTGKTDISALYPQTTPVLVPGEGIAPVQKPKRLPKKMEQIVKKADLATRLQPIPVAEIPYESVTWDPAAKAPKSVSGKSKIVDYGGRKMMVVNVNGTNVPFYLSTGLAGKSKVPSGKWYPFFGIGADGWINKTSQEEIANYYGDEDLKRVAQTLDATVGDIRGNNSIPRIGTGGAHTSFINSGLDPSENGTPQTLEKVSNNIKNVLSKIRSAKPVEQVVEEARTEPMLALPAPVTERPVEGTTQAIVEEQPVGAAEVAPVEAQFAVMEPPPPAAPVNPEFDTFAAPPVVDQIEQEAIRKAMAERRNAIGEGVRAALKRYNLKDVDTKFVPALMDKMGKVQPAQGSEVMVGDKSIVNLATDVYDPNLSIEDMVNKVIDALNHESIHSLFDLGLIRPAERQILLNAVETAKVPGKKYTYLDFAKLTYDPSRPGLEIYSDPNLVREEAVAEMYRDWRKRQTGAPPNTRGLFNRITEALRNIFNVMRRNNYEGIFKDIESGRVGSRERMAAGKVGTPKFSIAPSTNSDEFKRWFAGSVVRNPDGTPKVFYHGTDVFDNIDEFIVPSFFTDNPEEAGAYTFWKRANKRQKLLSNQKYRIIQGDAGISETSVPYTGIISDIPFEDRGKIYATDQGVVRVNEDGKVDLFSGWLVDYETPSEYGSINIKRGDGLKEAQELVDEWNDFINEKYPAGEGENGRIYPVYLSIKNPVRLGALEANQLGARLNTMTKEEVVKYIDNLKAKGYDGIVTQSDEAVMFPEVAESLGGIPEQYIPFYPEQVKSVYNEFKEGAASSPKLSIAPAMPKLAVAPVYPYGQRVPQVNASDTDRVISELEYGAIVTKLAKLFKSKTLSSVVPERFRPSEEAITDFVRKWADKILPVGQMIDYVKQNGGTVPDALDVYQKAQLSQSITANNLEARERDLYEPLVKGLKESGISLGEFENYLYALHAPERNERLREITPIKRDKEGNEIPFDPSFGSGMSDEKAGEIVNLVQSDPRYASFVKYEEMVRKIIDDTNQLRIDSGLSPDFDLLPMTVEKEDGTIVTLRPFEKYVPLRGFADESAVEGELEEEFRARVGQGFKIKGREDMRAMGRTSEASDILAHIMLQNSEAVVRAEKNKVGLSFLDLIEANPEIMAQYGVEIIEPGKKPMRKVVSSKGIIKSMVDPMYKNRDDVFVVKREGVEVPISINNRMLQKALITNKSADPASNGKFIRALGWLNRSLAAMNTVYNPEFALVNFPRDIQQALLNVSQYEIDGIKTKILKDALPAAKGVFAILRKPETQNNWSRWYKEFREDGGNTSGFYGAFSVDEQVRKIEKIASDQSGSATGRAKIAFNAVKKWMEDYNGTFENAVRLSVYKNLVEAGASRQKAAFIAKNITVNFDQRGEFGPVMNSLYLFYNASVQGTMTLLTAAARSKKVRRALGGLVMFGFIQDQINSMMSDKGEDDEPLYDKLPDYKLENNIILMDPFGLTDKGYIAIPLAYGANSFVNLGRAMSRNLRGGYTTSEAATSMVTTFIDAFNPVGGTESFLNFVVPTALDPVVALSMNLDYSGRRIYPEAFPGSIPKANSQTYFSSTSPAAISVAQFLNEWTGGSEYVPGYISIKPDAMEYVYDYILGATGATARRVVDTAMNDVPKLLAGDLENIEINNVPVLRKVYGNVSERMSFEDYFDKVNHVLTRGEELKFAMKEGDPARIKAVRQKYADELKIYPAIKALANRRNKLAAELRKVRENEKMPPEQKRRRQEILQKQIEEITNRVDKLYGKQIGDKYPGLFS